MVYFLRGDFDPIAFAAFIIVAFFAFAYHELGHALMANYLGDPTPREYGRMTLNPFPHISWLGMIMLVLIGFGWAVTPINPRLMRGNPRTSHAIVALAGPAANLVMAALYAIPLRLISAGIIDLNAFAEAGMPATLINFIFQLFIIGVNLNLFLIALNLLPIPPLDGYWVLRAVLPVELAFQLDALQQYGMLIFIAIIFLLPQFGISIFPAINSFTALGFSILTGL